MMAGHWVLQAPAAVTSGAGTVDVLKVVATLALQGQVVQEADHQLALLLHLH